MIPGINEQIRKLKKSLVSSIGHAICYGKLADKDFKPHLYLWECRDVFQMVGIEKKYINQILVHGLMRGLKEYDMLIAQGSRVANAIRESSLNHAHAASQVKPIASPMMAEAEELGFICEEIMGAYKQVAPADDSQKNK